MRFVITGEWSKNSLLRLILFMFLIFVLLFTITSALMYFTKMDLTPQSVVAYFLGEPNVEFGREAKPYASMVENSHIHLFAFGMLMMVLTHLLLFVPIPIKLKAIFVFISFSSALMSEISNWLVRFVSPNFAWLKIISFLTMELSLSGLALLLTLYIFKPERNAYKDSAS
ncbi:MAG: hypothetical protein QGI45_17575 [Myxococcota bacterium]|jgi:hypothetical protein|nr:hypothetical protein [Myxococcota bacterium]